MESVCVMGTCKVDEEDEEEEDFGSEGEAGTGKAPKSKSNACRMLIDVDVMGVILFYLDPHASNEKFSSARGSSSDSW